MTSRERVEAAVNHKEPDRIPIDLWGSTSRLCNSLYFQIVEHEGWNELGECVKASRSGDYVDYRVSDMIDADFRHTNIGHPKYFKKWINENGDLMNEWGYGSKEIAGSSVVSFNPLANADESDIEKHHWPKIEDPGRIEGLEEQVSHWHERTDYYITSTTAVSGLMIDICPYLRGFEQFFMDLYLNPRFAHKLIGKVTDVLIELYLYYLKPIGKHLGWVEFSSDHGMQDRALVSPEIYRKFFKKQYARLFSEVRKAAPNAKIWMHSCGSVRELIPDFIDMGLDILNSLQPRAAGMDSNDLKKKFGNELVFHGGLDIQGGITGSVKDAESEARARIDAFAPGGGYIFAPSNHYMDDVPMENFFAVNKVAREYGGSYGQGNHAHHGRSQGGR
ncbi:MAG: uroporphyrinogen decarboxylase family protein [Rectinemataceae bacterium]